MVECSDIVSVPVGDGAGVGKGRTIAGIIYQNYLEGRKKALWLIVHNILLVCCYCFDICLGLVSLMIFDWML